MNYIMNYGNKTNLLQGSENFTQKCVIVIKIIVIKIYFKIFKIQFNSTNCKHFPLHICTIYTFISYVYESFQMHIHYTVYFYNFN